MSRKYAAGAIHPVNGVSLPAAASKTASKFRMESSDTPPQLSPGENNPIASVPFEVVRRSEFVFEPFMGSLIQLPEARIQRAQSSEFFLARSPMEPVSAHTSASGEEALVWERPHPFLQASTPAVPALTDQRPSFAGPTPKTAVEPPESGFYQPQPVRFFDPVAASVGDPETADLPEQLLPRTSPRLSPELKAAILRIDEQRRQMQQADKSAKDKKHGFRKAKPAKAADVHEYPVEIVSPPNVNLTERVARWEEISAPQPAAVDAATDINGAVETPTTVDTKPAADIEHVAAMSSAVAPEPVTASMPTVVWTGEVDSSPEIVTPLEAVPPQHAAVIHAAVPEPQAEQPQEILRTSAQEAISANEFVLSPEPVPIPQALHSPDPFSMSEESESPPQTATEEASTAPTLETAAFSAQPTAQPEEDLAFPVVFAVDPFAKMRAEEEQNTTAPESLSTQRVNAAAAALSRLRRADLVTEPVAAATPQTPIAQQPSEEEEYEKKLRRKRDKLSLSTRLHRWLGGEAPKLDGNRRRAERRIMPGLVAFYWSGGTPRPHEIVNISKTGFYLKTTEFWAVETLVRMTLQRQRSETNRKGESVSVLARVVRIDADGVGHEFVTTEALMHARSMDVMPSHGTDWRELDKFLQVL
jgi:PilZ domain